MVVEDEGPKKGRILKLLLGSGLLATVLGVTLSSFLAWVHQVNSEMALLRQDLAGVKAKVENDMAQWNLLREQEARLRQVEVRSLVNERLCQWQRSSASLTTERRVGEDQSRSEKPVTATPAGKPDIPSKTREFREVQMQKYEMQRQLEGRGQ